MFSCEFCEISKNTFFYRTPPVAASELFLRIHHWSSSDHRTALKLAMQEKFSIYTYKRICNILLKRKIQSFFD